MPTNQATRLTELRQAAGLTLRELADAIGNLRGFSQLSKYETDPTARLSGKVVEALAKVYKTTPEYITKGIKPATRKPFNSMPPRTLVTDNLGAEKILLVPVKAQAGYRQHVGDENFLLGELRAYSLPGFERGTYRIFEVAGDSMVPRFKEGDLVICEYVESPAEIKDGWPHVVVTDDGLCLKYVTNAENSGGVLIIASENPAYKADVIPVDDVRELWAYRKVMTTT